MKGKNKKKIKKETFKSPIEAFYHYFMGLYCFVEIFISYMIWSAIIIFTWYATEYPIFHSETLFWFFWMIVFVGIMIFAGGLTRLLMPL